MSLHSDRSLSGCSHNAFPPFKRNLHSSAADLVKGKRHKTGECPGCTLQFSSKLPHTFARIETVEGNFKDGTSIALPQQSCPCPFLSAADGVYLHPRICAGPWFVNWPHTQWARRDRRTRQTLQTGRWQV